MISRRTIMAGIAATLTCFGASQSEGAFISFSQSLAQVTVPSARSFNLSKFDTSLGTLTGVSITFTSNVTGVLTVYNFTNQTQTFTNGSASVTTTLTGPDGSSTSVLATSFVASGTVPAGDPSAPSSANFTGTTGTNTSTTAIAAANFGAYEGAGGTFGLFLAIAGQGTYGGSSASGVAFTGSATAGGTATVGYTYTPTVVPEPSSLALVGLGGLGLVARLRRRRAIA